MTILKTPNKLAILLLFVAGPNLSATIETAGIAPGYVPGSNIAPVAEEGAKEPKNAAIVEATVERMLVDDLMLFKQLMNDRVHDEADIVAKRIVEMTIRTKSRQSREFANALTNLAIVQYRAGQFDSAQQNFQKAIETIEDNEDRLNERLVNPLKGLGAVQLASGRPDRASTTFKRAVHITHVNQGPHNRGQMELLESITEIHYRMGSLKLVQEVQETILGLNIKEYGLNSLELVPALMHHAGWQHRAGAINGERSTYRRVIQIVKKNSGRNDLQLVEPLIFLGESFSYIDTSGAEIFIDARKSTAEVYFRRATRIATEHPDTTWRIASRAKLALGDYYMIDNNPRDGRQVYRDAWNILSDDKPRLEIRREQLERVVLLKQHELPQYISIAAREGESRNSDQLLRGKIAMSYEVSILGRATKLKMVEAEPPEFTDMQRSVRRELRRRTYRPRFEDGKAVRTPDQLLVHEFFYDHTEFEAAQIAASSGENK